MENLEKNMKLLELTIQEEKLFLQEHQTRVKFYSGLVSALIVATLAGFLNAKQSYHYYALATGPVLTFLISTFALEGTFRMYQRFLEAIATRAKIEQNVGLTKLDSDADEKEYWKTESIIASRHLVNRKKYDSSDDFVKAGRRKGYDKSTRYLFRTFQLVSIALMVGLIATGIYK